MKRKSWLDGLTGAEVVVVAPKPPDRAARLAGLRHAADAMAAGELVNADVAAWLAPALRAFAADGGDFAVLAGLRRPGKSGRFPSHRHVIDLQGRNRCLYLLVRYTPGPSLRARAQAVLAFLLRNGPRPCGDAEVLRRALQRCDTPVPRTLRQLLNIYAAVDRTRL